MNNEKFLERKSWTCDEYGGSELSGMCIYGERWKNLKQCFERRSECAVTTWTWFYVWPNRDGNRLLLLVCFQRFLGFEKGSSWWLFWGKRIYGYNESVRSDGVVLRGSWRATLAFICFQSGQIAPVLDDGFLVRIMEYSIGRKGRLDFTYGYSPGRCKQYWPTLSKKWLAKIKSLQWKDVSIYSERDASGVTCWSSTVYFGKVGLTWSKGKRLLEAYRKDLETYF